MVKDKKKFIIIMILVIVPFILEAFIVFSMNDEVGNIFTKDSGEKIKIFNGKDISNLIVIGDDKTKNIDDYYKIKGRAIYFKSGFKGYLRTNKSFSNFKLHAEWKWTKKNEKGNSGILVFIQPPDTVWPQCIQINFKADNAGDLIAMNGASFKEAEGKPKETEVKLEKSSEKPEGVWNSCDITCLGDSMSVYINGVLQNKASGIKTVEGAVGWQLEGKAIAMRNIYLIKK